MKKQKYVLGFLFDEDFVSVVLIKKNKPVWQSGLLNGVGGKIEENELPLEAMIREFKEETSLDISDWKQIGTMQGETWEVHCFKSSSDIMYEAITTTSEEIIISEVAALDFSKTINNLSWLIPFCFDNDKVMFHAEYS